MVVVFLYTQKLKISKKWTNNIDHMKVLFRLKINEYVWTGSALTDPFHCTK